MLRDHQERWDGVGGRQAQEGGDICVHTAASLHCAAETSITSESNYASIEYHYNICLHLLELVSLPHHPIINREYSFVFLLLLLLLLLLLMSISAIFLRPGYKWIKI